MRAFEFEVRTCTAPVPAKELAAGAAIIGLIPFIGATLTWDMPLRYLPHFLLTSAFFVVGLAAVTYLGARAASKRRSHPIRARVDEDALVVGRKTLRRSAIRHAS